MTDIAAEISQRSMLTIRWCRELLLRFLGNSVSPNDPLLGLRGSGMRLWADEHADEYLRRLREGWE